MAEFSVESTQVQLVRAFTSIVDPGLILLIGDRAASYSPAALEGLGALSKLVVNLKPESTIAEIETGIELDIRAAIHRQNSREFLADVSHHNLNLVVIAADELQVGLAEQVEEMLVDGGCLIVLKTQLTKQEMSPISAEKFFRLDLDSSELFVKKAFKPPNVRRGGRRSRLLK